MSFSSDVKMELSKHTSNARHCQIAELSAMLFVIGSMCKEDEKYNLELHTENEVVAKKCAYLVKKIFGEEPSIVHNTSRKAILYKVVIEDEIFIDKILLTTKVSLEESNRCIDKMVLQKSCCKRAFLRGVFLSSGSISDPEKTYHFEVVCDDMNTAKVIRDVFVEFDIDAKIVLRKKYFVVYVKEGAMIVDALNIMEAHGSLMNMENVRIVKDMRNTINRRVNCETANLNKTVSAAVKQIEDINYIDSIKGLSSLSSNLKEMAYLRLEEPDASLKELGEMLNPPVSRSGVNHRLRKLSEISKDLREGNLD